MAHTLKEGGLGRRADSLSMGHLLASEQVGRRRMLLSTVACLTYERR